MNFLSISRGFLRRRWVTVLLSVLSIATGTALVTGILLLRDESRNTFSQKDTGYEIIVGAKGSPLQLVLNTMYHVGAPVGNIPLDVYEKLARDRRVGVMLPMVFGDNISGFRVVGTAPQFFSAFEYRKGRRVRVETGRPFAMDYEAVIGSDVAQATGLKLGSTVLMTHGMHEGGEVHDFERLTITGVLVPTQTAIDRGVFTTLRTVWDAHYREYQHQQEAADALLAEAEGGETTDYDHAHGDDHSNHVKRDSLIPPDFTTITAIAVRLKSPVFFDSFMRSVNDRTAAQAVLPVREIAELFVVVGNIHGLLLIVSYLVVAVGAISMFIAMYTSLHERRREVAVLRALGAHRRTILGLMLTEAVLTGLAGAVVGLVVARVALVVAEPAIRAQTGVAIAVTGLHVVEVFIACGVVLLAVVTALLPAYMAYRVDVSDHLASTG